MKNKRKTITLSICCILGAVILLCAIKYIRLPEYRMFNAFSQSYTLITGERGRDTTISIIVYKNRYDENLYKRIMQEHNRINGEPSELEIRLFKSKADITKGHEPYKVIIIDYRDNTVKIE